jgi:hypothetical protein
MLCKYKDILGKPNEGFHKTRFLGFALNDIIGTIIIGIIISKIFNYDLFKTYILLILFVIFIHKLFCVETTLNKMLF